MRLCNCVAVSPLVELGRRWARFNLRPTEDGRDNDFRKLTVLTIMRRIFLLVCFVLLTQGPILVAQKVDLRNYVIGGYDPNPNEIRLAQGRAHAYWQKNGARFGDKARYLAVEAASVMPGDVIQPLWQNMMNAQTGSGFLLPAAWNPGKMHCIIIYDTLTGGFVSKHGYLVVETPRRETLARFGDYIALYVRTGTFW